MSMSQYKFLIGQSFSRSYIFFGRLDYKPTSLKLVEGLNIHTLG